MSVNIRVGLNYNQAESLLNRSLNTIVEHFEQIDLNQLLKLPDNIISFLLKIFSKRGHINDANIQIFLSSQKTKILELNDCLKLTNLGCEKIVNCKNLMKLDLSSNESIESNTLVNIANSCKYLRIILLSRCSNVNDSCIEAFAKNCSKMTQLNINYCSMITNKACESIGKYCKYLRSINLSGTKITNDGILNMINDNLVNSIEEIHISHCDFISDESIECILLKCKMIKYLLFHSCSQMTDASRQALEDHMTNSNLKLKHLTWSIY